MTLKQELRSKAIQQFINAAEARKKILKIETLYFNDPVGGITHYMKMPYDHTGKIVPFTNVKGSSLLKMTEEIISGNIYGWIEYKGSRCKVRPKKIGK
jgi:3-polyprenyl-4-hydroxybenzoate decarboxylase